ncbi:Alpha/Beta hydrolase protein [Tricharina praecox]|uniref:Alpha/Beta hydrolase protein n=1 Tax=Tricharina praecox TaxID=43433 RepID=UPI00221EFB16|nr:Alpha/Beta hydrolase protein [Tricharina praecox]KAI5854622.1 Alpha/Beta hydrolase protein [Tricharina praecox]
MSDLRKSFLKSKLQHLPRSPPMPTTHPLSDLSAFDEEEEEGLELEYDEGTLPPPSPLLSDSSSASSASSTGTIKPLFSRPAQPRKKPTFEPIPWQAHFSLSLHLTPPDSPETSYHAYLTPPLPSGPLFVFHHGAGSSGLSSALLATSIRRLLPSAGILSPDCRGHGETHTPSDNDLSLPTLTSDLYSTIQLTATQQNWPTLPPLVLIGHSLGGAVVVSLAASRQLGDALLGYAVIDVVEGSAIDALTSMSTYLHSRPTSFSSLSHGIEWHTRSRTLRNPTSARISVPALLVPSPAPNPSSPTTPITTSYTWRTDLSSTQPFWQTWFTGLSSRFLTAPGGKLLLLAGTDRLDKELMIGQMQGKYQLLVLPEVGHFVHEDAPERVAAALVEFYKRNDRSVLVLPPKVGASGGGAGVGGAAGAGAGVQSPYLPAAGKHYTSI